MTGYEVDRACGQTPCLCGDIETWHPECYRGKTQETINLEYKKAYAIARRKLKKRAKEMLNTVIRAC